MKLAVISHTEHFRDSQGCIIGWGPTIRELNHLAEFFDEIWHIAVIFDCEAPPSAISYTSTNIHFVGLQPFGGPTLKDKLLLVQKAPKIISTVGHIIAKVDYWQFRAPTGIGVFLIPWLTFFTKKPGWFKYAGNWVQVNPPTGYWWQRFWLRHLQRRKVTINGHWPGQPKHCLSFENPCLDEDERKIGYNLINKKNYSKKRSLCFVGHLTEAKGAHWLVSALYKIDPSTIEAIHIVGNGPLMADFETLKSIISFPIYLHGYCSRDKVAEIMSLCHIIVLPSKAEGFPKVIAEAANYGCVPVVSDISALGQYICEGINGFLIAPKRLYEGKLNEDLMAILKRKDLDKVAHASYEIADDFTFEKYIFRIKKEILGL